MSLSCRKCGGLVERVNPKKPWPHKCKQCKLDHERDRQRRLRKRVDWSGLRCGRCNEIIQSFPRRGRPSKWCKDCLRAIRSEQGRARKQRARESGEDKTHRLVCKLCGVGFNSDRIGQKYCSSGCAHLAVRDRVWLTCRQCKKSFEKQRKQAETRHYCSWACWQESHAASRCQCQQCGKEFKRKAYKHAWQGKNKFCSRECAWDHRWGADRPRNTTSEKAKLGWSQKSRATTLKHRCRHYGCEFDPECTREAVCDRDGWVCQDCGIRCHKGVWRIDKKTRKVSPRSAEHDHIWPLSVRGGPGNVMHNSQCLCRKCNGKKRNRLKGQMRINFSG
jgi:hypothetical protein